jgi:hypothetical protein
MVVLKVSRCGITEQVSAVLAEAGVAAADLHSVEMVGRRGLGHTAPLLGAPSVFSCEGQCVCLIRGRCARRRSLYSVLYNL